MKETTIDVIIVGAGAAGLVCASEAGKRGRNVLVIDSANKPGKKILMSGGGRCNFTNLDIQPDKYLSHNPHFCKSALSRYTQWDFIKLVESHGIEYHEKTLGQLFCDFKSKAILNMLLQECDQPTVTIKLNTTITAIKKVNDQYVVSTNIGDFNSHSIVVASGGYSIPSLGASGFGYDLAKQFGLNVYPTRAGLVPLTFNQANKVKFEALPGVSTFCQVQTGNQSFLENILFTHKGLSGPAILQISSYWQHSRDIEINFMPKQLFIDLLNSERAQNPKKSLKKLLYQCLPQRLVDTLFVQFDLSVSLGQLTNTVKEQLIQIIHQYAVQPNGTEGYKTAEVTVGGVDCNELSSKTFESKQHPGLYFIGEVVDVTGWLGGYNFQWAWSSGWAAGQVV